MYFQLVYGDFEYPLLLPFEEHVEERSHADIEPGANLKPAG